MVLDVVEQAPPVVGHGMAVGQRRRIVGEPLPVDAGGDGNAVEQAVLTLLLPDGSPSGSESIA